MSTPHGTETFTEADVLFDRDHIWHPYSSTVGAGPTFAVTGADGVRLHLADGRQLIDGMASWWSAIHGYNHPDLNRALVEQASRMAHVMFGGLTHKPAVELCRRLVDMSPASLHTVFLADSGSVAVEVALKMAIQYWQSLGHDRRRRFLTVRGGYHGDTLGAMAVCDPDNGMHTLFRGVLTEHIFVDRPLPGFSQACQSIHTEQLAAAMQENHRELAGVILEPVLQGAGGMRFYSPDYLREVHRLCRKYNVLLLLDEIATGFGRTGKLFACQHADVEPDIMMVGKALTGGYMSLAATLCTREVSDAIGQKGAFMHGPTFMANPLACRVACASLDIVASGAWKNDVARIERRLTEGLAPCRSLASVKDVRVLGAVGVVELQQPVNMQEIALRFVDEGIWVRPFGKLVYVMPPYVICDQDLQTLCQGIVRTVSATGQ